MRVRYSHRLIIRNEHCNTLMVVCIVVYPIVILCLPHCFMAFAMELGVILKNGMQEVTSFDTAVVNKYINICSNDIKMRSTGRILHQEYFRS